MTINHKIFAPYGVLKAADVNDFLMNQTVVKIDTESELTSLPTAVKLAYLNSNGFVYRKDSTGAWKIAHSPVPTFRAFRTVGGPYNLANTFVAIPYDSIDATYSYNPNNEYFGYNTANATNDRRIQIKKPGLYSINLETAGTGTINGTRIALMSGGQTLGASIASSGTSNVTGLVRVAVSEFVGGAVMQSASDVADNTNGYRNHIIITRLGD